MSYTKETWDKVGNMNLPCNLMLGPVNTESLIKDPKHLAFTLSRYKFAAKMIRNRKHIIEIGCGEGIGAFMFLAETKATITAIDFDKSQIEYARNNVLQYSNNRIEFIWHDMVDTEYKGKKAEGLVCLDVIEHVHHSEEDKFFINCASAILDDGIAIIGTPNESASKYASARSKEGHINLFDSERLIPTLEKYFKHVFLFSMNDEMVHTGYNKLAHYFMVLCIK